MHLKSFKTAEDFDVAVIEHNNQSYTFTYDKKTRCVDITPSTTDETIMALHTVLHKCSVFQIVLKKYIMKQYTLLTSNDVSIDQNIVIQNKNYNVKIVFEDGREIYLTGDFAFTNNKYNYTYKPTFLKLDDTLTEHHFRIAVTVCHFLTEYNKEYNDIISIQSTLNVSVKKVIDMIDLIPLGFITSKEEMLNYLQPSYDIINEEEHLIL